MTKGINSATKKTNIAGDTEVHWLIWYKIKLEVDGKPVDKASAWAHIYMQAGRYAQMGTDNPKT